MQEYTEEFETVKGHVLNPSLESTSRLMFYLQQESEIEDTDIILVCIAENGENKRLLERLHRQLVNTEEPILILGERIEGTYKEYLEGVDFRVSVVAYYDPTARRYIPIITAYGDSIGDLLKRLEWKRFLYEMGKGAAKAVI
jgi:hypothetical protein